MLHKSQQDWAEDTGEFDKSSDQQMYPADSVHWLDDPAAGFENKRDRSASDFMCGMFAGKDTFQT